MRKMGIYPSWKNNNSANGSSTAASPNAPTTTTNSAALDNESVTNHRDEGHEPMALKSPLGFSGATFDGALSSAGGNTNAPAVPLPLPSPHKSSTRVWRLKKYRSSDAEQQSTLIRDPLGAKGSSFASDHELLQPTTLAPSKNGTRRLPPRRPKTDKNGNPLEFVFIDASPLRKSTTAEDDETSAEQPQITEQSTKRPGKFPKNIFRLSSGSRKESRTINTDIATALKSKISPSDEYPDSAVLALKLSSTLQDLTRARNSSVSSVNSRHSLKRNYTSILLQSRLPASSQASVEGNTAGMARSDSLVYITIDDNGRAAVLHQPQLSKTISSSSSVVSDFLNSTRSRSPPAERAETQPPAPQGLYVNTHFYSSPLLQQSPYFNQNNQGSTPYSLSATDDDEDALYDDNDELFIGSQASDNDYEFNGNNDALILFSKVIGSKRQQLSRKNSSVSISSNFNNMTLANTPVLSPTVSRPLHQRSLSSLSQTALPSRRSSPVRRRLRHSQSVSITTTPDISYYQSGINNKLNPYMLKTQSVRQNSAHSTDSASFDRLGPALDLSSSYTTLSMSSVATPTSPELHRGSSGDNKLKQKQQQLSQQQLPQHQLPQHQLPQLLSQMPHLQSSHDDDLGISSQTWTNPVSAFNNPLSSAMHNLGSIESSKTLTSNLDPSAQLQPNEEFADFDLFDFISYDNNQTYFN